MIRTSLLGLLAGILLMVQVNSSVGYKINITLFENCEDQKEREVELLTVRYDYVDNLCDTVHGTYIIYKKHLNLDYEMWMTVNNCASGSTGPCRDNEVKFIEPMKCTRFHDDDSGPWYMISSATAHEKCGEVEGEFNLDTATLKPEYLTNFITISPDMSRYRIKMLFHKKGTPEVSEQKKVRGCVNMEFELIH